MEQAVCSSHYTRNVYVFKYDDVTRRNNDLFTPNLMEMARLRKTEQFRKDICFNVNMSGDDIRKTLEEAFLVLKNKRFSCAARAAQGSAKLDFHGECRVWDGSTVKKKLRGQSALYLVMEDKFEETSQVSGSATITTHDSTGLSGDIASLTEIPDDLKDVHPANLDFDFMDLQDLLAEIAQEDSQRDTPATKPLLDRAENGNIQTTLKNEQSEAPVITVDHNHETNEATAESGFSSAEESLTLDTIHPSRGPLEGGESFYLEFDKSLPDSVKCAWAEFGHKRAQVWKTYEGNTLHGKRIPRGEKPGRVSVTITKLTGEYLGETVYTYIDGRRDESEKVPSNKRQLADLFDKMAKRLKGDDSAGNETQDSQQQGLKPEDIILPLLSAAAETGAKNFIEAVFNSSAGRIVFEAYKGKSPLPEDVAEENGHEEIAAYLRGIAKKFSEKDGTSHIQSKVTDWLDVALAEDFVDSKEQPGPSFGKHLREEDISETSYFGDAETSSSGSGERTDCNDDLVINSFCKGPRCCQCNCGQKTGVEANDPSQDIKGEMRAEELLSLLKDEISKMSARNEELEDELSIARQKCQETEKEVSKMSTRTRELEDELASARQSCQETEQQNSKLQAKIKELEEARQQKQEDIDNTGSPDTEETSVVSTDSNELAREHRMRMKLEDLKQQLTTYVTSPLEVREVNQDQLDIPVKLDLLTRLSKSLQELYSETGMVLETCKCGEDLKREFYDFAYHGLRGEHNDLVHRVKDLESTQGEMSEEEKKAFENLQGYQVNRQKLVEMLEKLWRGFFSPPERLPKTPCSAPVEDSDKTSDYKKVTRRTVPGARTKEKKTRDEATSSPAPSNSDHDNYEVRLNIAKQRKSVRDMLRRKESDENTCTAVSFTPRRDS